MRNGVGYWMMSRPCPPIEDMTAFSGEWRASRPRSPALLVALWTRLLSWSDLDPMGSTLTMSADPIDFEVALRVM